jgi:hypothetical protein
MLPPSPSLAFPIVLIIKKGGCLNAPAKVNLLCTIKSYKLHLQINKFNFSCYVIMK